MSSFFLSWDGGQTHIKLHNWERMGKKEKSTFISLQLSCNRRISCTATSMLHFSDTFVAGIGKERQKLKQNHLRSMHWTASNLSILYYTKQWRQNWYAFQGPVLQAVRTRSGFSGRSLKIWFFKKILILFSAYNVRLVKYFSPDRSYYCFRLDRKSNIKKKCNNTLANVSWTSCSHSWI